jgi:hypothetical protein
MQIPDWLTTLFCPHYIVEFKIVKVVLEVLVWETSWEDADICVISAIASENKAKKVRATFIILSFKLIELRNKNYNKRVYNNTKLNKGN